MTASMHTGPWLMVTLAIDVAPFTKGSRVALPRATAERLVREGTASDPAPFPPQQPAEFTTPEPKPTLAPRVAAPVERERPRPGKRYQTRNR